MSGNKKSVGAARGIRNPARVEGNLTIGIEAEFSTQNFRRENRGDYNDMPERGNYSVHNDGSLNGRRPGELKIDTRGCENLDHVESAFSYARGGLTLRVSRSCGQHVHVFFGDRRDAAVAFARLAARIGSPERGSLGNMSCVCSEYVLRRSFEFQKLWDRPANPFCSGGIGRVNAGSKKEEQSTRHYAGIALTHKSSIEFRRFSATTDPKKAWARALFCKALVLGIAHRGVSVADRFNSLARYVFPGLKMLSQKNQEILLDWYIPRVPEKFKTDILLLKYYRKILDKRARLEIRAERMRQRADSVATLASEIYSPI